MVSRCVVQNGIAWALLASLACSPAPLTLPSEGGKAWHELTSPHFVVQTNVELDAAQQMVSELERAYWALERVGFAGGPKIETLTHVAIFDGLQDLKPLGYEWAAGAFVVDSVGLSDTPPILLLPEAPRSKQAARELLQHELSHRFVHHHFPSAPPWLNEGLAEYYSTLEVDDEQVRVGRYLSRTSFGEVWGHGLTDGIVYLLVPKQEVPSLAQLRAMDAAAFYGRYEAPDSDAAEKHRILHYASAWAAVHALSSVPDESGNFERYLALLRAGKGEPEAFADAFGSLSEEELEASLRGFVRGHETDVATYPLERAVETPVARVDKLSAARVQLLLSQVRLDPKATATTRLAEIERAIEVDRFEPEGYRARALFHLRQRDLEAAARDAAAARKLAPLWGVVLFWRFAQGNPSPQLERELTETMEQLRTRATTAAQLNLLARLVLVVRKNTGGARRSRSERWRGIEPATAATRRWRPRRRGARSGSMLSASRCWRST